mgnify:CR=1 FL=1
MKCGKGKFYWNDGTFYEGEFEKNNINGYGVIKWADGSSYQGDWVDNKKEG